MSKYQLIGTGTQAPYGIGETISTHRTLKAAQKAARAWYNPPRIEEVEA